MDPENTEQTAKEGRPRMTQADADRMNAQMSAFFLGRRRELGMTQGDVGRSMMVGGQSSVSCLERNQTQWRLDQIACYCSAVGLQTITLNFQPLQEQTHDQAG